MRSASSSALAIALRALEEANEEHARAIFKNKMRMNALTFIALLPPEILSLVFVYLVQEQYEEAALLARTPYNDPSAPPNTWIKISHVCRDWRTTALATPRFWSYIMLTYNFPVEEFLARSRQASLSVLAEIGPPSHLWQLHHPRQALFARILLEFSRLQVLRLNCPPRNIATFCENIRVSGVAPLLETIDISTTNGYPWDVNSSVFMPHVFLPERLPRIHTLNVSKIAFVWDNPMFSATLTKLVISGHTSSRSDLGSFENFLDALERMASLQVLDLDTVIPPLTTPPSHLHPRKVALPALTSLKLVAAAEDCSRLLEHVILPTDTRCHIAGAGPIRNEDLFAALRDHLSDPMHLRAVCLRRGDAGELRLRGWRDATRATQSNRTPHPVDLELKFFIDAPLLTSLLRGPGILSDVSVLEVRMHRRDWQWKDIFAGMPRIRVLEVYYDQPLCARNLGIRSR